MKNSKLVLDAIKKAKEKIISLNSTEFNSLANDEINFYDDLIKESNFLDLTTTSNLIQSRKVFINVSSSWSTSFGFDLKDLVSNEINFNSISIAKIGSTFNHELAGKHISINDQECDFSVKIINSNTTIVLPNSAESLKSFNYEGNILDDFQIDDLNESEEVKVA